MFSRELRNLAAALLLALPLAGRAAPGDEAVLGAYDAYRAGDALKLERYAAKLEGQPGVEQIAAFGSALHVTGRDSPSLEQSIREVIANTASKAEPSATGLEDVFIHLTERATDNYAKKPQ
jgi:ABC-2 type transport system ATP-binding protein